MSQAKPSPPTQQRGPEPRPQPQPILVNPGFQLKYTGALVGVALVLLLGLGVAIERVTALAARSAIAATHEAERARSESDTNSRLVRMNEISRSADDPERVRTLERELAAIDAQAAQNAQRAREERDRIQRDRRLALFALAASAVLMVLALSLGGILITRRVVIPMLRMKRLLRKVTAGKLDIQERVGQGDELSELFSTFMDMVGALKRTQAEEIDKLEVAIREAESLNTPREVITRLRELKADMQIALEPPDATLTTMKISEIRALLAQATKK